MSTTMLRWLLSPRTSWEAWHLARTHRGTVSFDVAWRYAQVRRHPDEELFRQSGHRAEDQTQSHLLKDLE
ncbi:hypothetical protein [Streptomyces anulatus]|uniref:hypothetical protein n=1 Tax=Streptomyces anulatus TaxID=1892 RepID=UPI0038672798|nr:hypothetical protein OG391_32595 [Streptomyces anulatus]